ncbi:MAG: hypothetical protein K9J77_12845 [Rhodoferax sp.]|nr:hypothetical protein [Rhodoferax sp.]
MARSPVKRPEQPIVESKNDALRFLNPFAAASTFVSFTHSYSEITSDGSQTHVKSTTTRLADGKLSKESFEGQLPANAFADTVGKAQSQFMRHAEMLMQPWFSAFTQTRLPGKSED